MSDYDPLRTFVGAPILAAMPENQSLYRDADSYGCAAAEEAEARRARRSPARGHGQVLKATLLLVAPCLAVAGCDNDQRVAEADPSKAASSVSKPETAREISSANFPTDEEIAAAMDAGVPTENEAWNTAA